jgi:AraC-like DNA-binding protein
MKEQFKVYDIGTLSAFKSDDLLVSRFAPYLDIHKNLHLPHKHNFYHLVLFTQGAGTHAIDFKTFPVVPWQIYFMAPGQVHGWNFEGSLDGYVINFSAAFFHSFLSKPDYLEQFPFFGGQLNDSVINIPPALRQKVKDIFEEVVLESRHSQRLAPDMIRALMIRLFITLGRLSLPQQKADTQSYNHTLLKSFQKLIEQHYTTLKLPKQYAELLYITPNHLNALCNDVLGISAGEVIRKRIALEAKRLLVNFNLNIHEVADRLNFADNSYFTKFFKKQEGLSPEQFRKEINQNTYENFHD